MSKQKVQEKNGLDGYTAQPQNYGNTQRDFPFEIREIRGLNEMEVKLWPICIQKAVQGTSLLLLRTVIFQ